MRPGVPVLVAPTFRATKNRMSKNDRDVGLATKVPPIGSAERLPEELKHLGCHVEFQHFIVQQLLERPREDERPRSLFDGEELSGDTGGRGGGEFQGSCREYLSRGGFYGRVSAAA